MVADYFLIRRRTLLLDDLYRRHGAYEYTRGLNPRALLALVAGIALALIGLASSPPCSFLFSGAWFTGFFTSAAVYLLLMRKASRFSSEQTTPGLLSQ